MSLGRCTWDDLDLNMNEQHRWQAKWRIQEFLTLRHNNDNIAKPQIKQYLSPILALNSKAIRLVKGGPRARMIRATDHKTKQNTEISD